MYARSPESHQDTYDAVFRDPVARDLQWCDVRSLLTAVADVTAGRGGRMTFTRNGHALTVHPPDRADFSDLYELMRVRHFLHRSAEPPVAAEVHLLVVIDHRLARVYKTEFHGSVPEQIVPYDDAGAGRHLHHVADAAGDRREREARGFHAAVAKTLGRAAKILVLGTGAGARNAIERLLAEPDPHGRVLRERVFTATIVDGQDLTEDRLLARARKIYALQATAC